MNGTRLNSIRRVAPRSAALQTCAALVRHICFGIGQKCLSDLRGLLLTVSLGEISLAFRQALHADETDVNVKWRPGEGRRGGNNYMTAPSLDLAHAPEDDRGESPGREPIAEHALSGLFGGRWRLYTGVVIIAPRSAPVFTGAAVRDRCPNGTGWPAGTFR
jgi:murein DD-endopeptidase MepM/ murein hydrolase activator NlpD